MPSRLLVVACVFVVACGDDGAAATQQAATRQAPRTVGANQRASHEPASIVGGSVEASPEDHAPDRMEDPADHASREDRGSFRLVPRPEPFFVVESCIEARGASATEALASCRRLAARGDRFQRRFCRGRPEQVVELRPDDPVAFYRGCCWAVGATPAEAHAECERRRAAEWCEPDDPTLVHVATGPYPRHPPFGDFDGPDFAYLVAADLSEWLANDGEPPCFPAGTPIATEEGARAIEDVRIGDRVVTRRDDGLGLATVRGVKRRRIDRLIALDLGGETLRITPNHPVWLEGAWREARNVSPGDVLTTREGAVRVDAVRTEVAEVEVFTLRVGSPHTYFAGGVWVHNY